MKMFYRAEFKLRGQTKPRRVDAKPPELILEPMTLKLLPLERGDNGISANVMDVSRERLGILSSLNFPKGARVQIETKFGLLIKGKVNHTLPSANEYYSEIEITGLSDSPNAGRFN